MDHINPKRAGAALVELAGASLPWISWLAVLGGYMIATEHLLSWTWEQLALHVGTETAANGFAISSILNVAFLALWLVSYVELCDRETTADEWDF